MNAHPGTREKTFNSNPKQESSFEHSSCAVRDAYDYTLRNVAQAIAVYKPAFGAQEMGRSLRPDGKIMRAMIRIGASLFMMTDAFPNMACFSAGSLGGANYWHGGWM